MDNQPVTLAIEKAPEPRLDTRVRFLFKGAIGIAVQSQTGITLENIQKIASEKWKESRVRGEKMRDVASEIADVRIALTGIASVFTVNEAKAVSARIARGVSDYGQRGPSQPDDETQSKVFSWIVTAFTGATPLRRVQHLFEEVTELAYAVYPNMGTYFLEKYLKSTWEIMHDRRPSSIFAEIGGLRSTISAVASAHNICEQDVLNTLMLKNRAKSLEKIRAREAEKQKLDIFKS